jgi:hypothetical protein
LKLNPCAGYLTHPPVFGDSGWNFLQPIALFCSGWARFVLQKPYGAHPKDYFWQMHHSSAAKYNSISNLDHR